MNGLRQRASLRSAMVFLLGMASLATASCGTSPTGTGSGGSTTVVPGAAGSITNAGGAPSGGAPGLAGSGGVLGFAGNSASGGTLVSVGGGGQGGAPFGGGGTSSGGSEQLGGGAGGSGGQLNGGASSGGTGGSGGQLNGGASSGGAPAIPSCGDGSCNGAETQSTCCQDCGCQSGYTCTSNTCQANPRCGDGTCNGTETQSTCCQDCGCATNYSCSSNSCACSSSTPRWTNNMPNNPGYCVNLQQSYTQTSVAYVSVNNGPGYALKYGDYLDGSSGAVGTSYGLKVQCCYWDGCVGGQGTTVNGVISGFCTYAGNSVPCICTAQHSYTVKTTECGTDTGNVCGSGGFN